jgi:GntR family transcriptional regulator / MocR family aminotransferase
MDPLFEIPVLLAASRDRAEPQTHELYRQLREAIADGRLAKDMKLPPTREAKSLFGVSRNTLAAAYERLISEGYAVGRHGSGTYVAGATRNGAAVIHDVHAANASSRLNPFWLSEAAGAMNFWRDAPRADGVVAASQPVVDMRPGLVDLGQFPFDVFRRAAAKQLRTMEKVSPATNSPQGNRGNFRLREAITAHVALMRGVACHRDDVLVTSGAQQAFDLIARVLVKPGETTVAVEDPGYPPMRVAFAAAGAKLVPVPVDAQGLMVDALPRDASVVCLCPSHQFPLGVTMSPARRRQLVDFARANGATIVEDDYDGEFRHEGSPIEPLRTPANAEHVIYVGTLSKCMFPGLRLGYLIAPPWASRALVAAKNCMDWHCSTPLQTMVAEFIAAGHLRRHVRTMRAAYYRRQRFLLDALADDFGGLLAPIESQYGMHLCAQASDALDVEALARALQADGIQLHTLERYWLGAPALRGLVFGYGSAGVPQIRKALAALRRAA